MYQRYVCHQRTFWIFMSYANSSVVDPDTYWFSIPDPHINIGFKIYKKKLLITQLWIRIQIHCIWIHETGKEQPQRIYHEEKTISSRLWISVETKVETLGLLEHISLGTVKVTEDFFRQVTFGTAVTPGARIFIRRIFPIQDENDEKMMQKVIVTEAIKGESLTHIDDCHVLVIQVK